MLLTAGCGRTPIDDSDVSGAPHSFTSDDTGIDDGTPGNVDPLGPGVGASGSQPAVPSVTPPSIVPTDVPSPRQPSAEQEDEILIPPTPAAPAAAGEVFGTGSQGAPMPEVATPPLPPECRMLGYDQLSDAGGGPACGLEYDCGQGARTVDCVIPDPKTAFCFCPDGATIQLLDATPETNCFLGANACEQWKNGLSLATSTCSYSGMADSDGCSGETTCAVDLEILDVPIRITHSLLTECASEGSTSRCDCSVSPIFDYEVPASGSDACSYAGLSCADGLDRGAPRGDAASCETVDAPLQEGGCESSLQCRHAANGTAGPFEQVADLHVVCVEEAAGTFCVCDGLQEPLEVYFSDEMNSTQDGACSAMADLCAGQIQNALPGAEPWSGSDPALGGAGTTLGECEGFDAGALEASRFGANCDANTPETCPAGTHIDFAAHSRCAFCAPDTPENRTCDWARACFEPFLQSVAHSSGAKACESDADCYVLVPASSCGGAVPLALDGSIDEELEIIAEFFDEQNCSLCDGQPNAATPPPDSADAACVEGVCTLVP